MKTRVFVLGTPNRMQRVGCYNHHKRDAINGMFVGDTCRHDYSNGFLTASYIVKKRAFDASMFIPYGELVRLNRERAR